jgi:hypothetical protein
MDMDRLEWRYRHEAASMRAKAIRRDADRLCEELVLLSQCEAEHETVLRTIQSLLEELLLAQQLTLDFDCAARHEAEDPAT